ncbi:28 kDa heat- and acid-stable phosphoprotein-like isoform X3 [Impatiens glandulifera]|uniref:28 kDa heat- and acid-stable phosphoprotein-like isoform X3 n=1 Tax=Impatiens glandulifera TaxID=253017 RepID=UPI001FB0A7C7|nr:28 kDa heat- and acid-stable phosphoprotein-like isoform X3 [Impatiens glandulifera]
MGRGKFKGKPTGRRMFSTQEEMITGLSARPRTFKKEELKDKEQDRSDEELEQDSDHDQDQDHQKEEEAKKQKGVQGIIDIENPNLVKPKSTKKTTTTTTELSRRERQEIEKQKSHERYMKLQEQGKTDQAKKDLERLALIRQQRAEAAKKRQEEKSSKC